MINDPAGVIARWSPRIITELSYLCRINGFLNFARTFEFQFRSYWWQLTRKTYGGNIRRRMSWGNGERDEIFEIESTVCALAAENKCH